MKGLGGAMKIPPDFKGPLQPAELVKMQLEVIHAWTVEDSGAFVSQFGNKKWVSNSLKNLADLIAAIHTKLTEESA
ncbi:hypothetical protein B0H16DRAFT_1725898 [Mycena metata]|uniref:Uncharacterized protein n=1 Tax=Mycena metata TaxID=1033252 RepID=A0AAD7IS97_9AGAR|nr:hypothetical protein B0H16DRAFT_1725898 [Mycena metata]